MKNTSFFGGVTVLTLLSYPALLLTVRGSMGILFGVMLIASLAYLFSIRQTISASHWDKTSIAFALAMTSPVVAIFLSQAYHQQFDSQYYDWASRFLLAVPIYMALRQANIRTITALQYGLPLGALIGLLMLKLHPFDSGGRYTTAEFFNLIHFSDSALILGFLSLFSINWERKDRPIILVFKLSGFAAGIYMSIQSGERGGWSAMPILLLLWVASQNREKLWLKFGIAAVVVTSIAWLSYSMIDVVHSRIDSIFTDFEAYKHGNKDTSIGVRIQLYLAALHLFVENPIFGVTPNGFAQAMPSLQSNGMLTTLASNLGRAEVHSEILAKCANTGLFGLISILSIYLVPVVLSWQAIKSNDSNRRVAGFMVICLIAGFFMFGLTVEIFNLKMTATFVAFTLAILLAAATNTAVAKKAYTNISSENSANNSKEPLPHVKARKFQKLIRIFQYAKLASTPLLGVVSLTIAIFAINQNHQQKEALQKSAAQITNLNASVLVTQNELIKLQNEAAQAKSLQDDTQSKQDEHITTIIQNVSALQIRLKISPSLQEQLAQPASAVILPK